MGFTDSFFDSLIPETLTNTISKTFLVIKDFIHIAEIGFLVITFFLSVVLFINVLGILSWLVYHLSRFVLDFKNSYEEYFITDKQASFLGFLVRMRNNTERYIDRAAEKIGKAIKSSNKKKVLEGA